MRVSVLLCISSWIVQAMKHELNIRAGDLPPQDIYQLSPSDIKQLLLDVLQPQHTGRYSSDTHTPTPSTTSTTALLSLTPHPLFLAQLFFEDALYLSIVSPLVLNPFSFNYFIFCLVYVHILLSVSASTPRFALGIIKVLSYLISSRTH